MSDALRVLTLTQLAAFLNVSRPTAYNLVQSVGFPLPLTGFKTRRWSVDAVSAWMRSNAI